LRLFSFGGYGLALAALALVVFGAIECPPLRSTFRILPLTLLGGRTCCDVNGIKPGLQLSTAAADGQYLA